MLVYLNRYRESDTRETVRSDGSVSPETDENGYFDVDSLELDEWERVEVDDRVVQRTATAYEDVTAVSSPNRSDDDLPGRTLQLRYDGGEVEYVENAEFVEVVESPSNR